MRFGEITIAEYFNETLNPESYGILCRVDPTTKTIFIPTQHRPESVVWVNCKEVNSLGLTYTKSSTARNVE